MRASKSLGRRIRYARERKGLTQEELAKELNFTKQMISRWELGKNGINERDLEKMEKVLGVSLREYEKIYSGGELKVTPLDQITEMKDLGDQVQLIMDAVSIDSYCEPSVTRLLKCTLNLVLGYEVYYVEFQENRDSAQSKEILPDCPVSWEIIAEDIESLLDDDLYQIPGEFTKRYLEEDGSFMKLKIHHMAYSIGFELFEDFDEVGRRNGYVQQVGRLGEYCGKQLMMVLPSLDNSVITSYKCALLEIIELLRTTC